MIDAGTAEHKFTGVRHRFVDLQEPDEDADGTKPFKEFPISRNRAMRPAAAAEPQPQRPPLTERALAQRATAVPAPRATTATNPVSTPAVEPGSTGEESSESSAGSTTSEMSAQLVDNPDQWRKEYKASVIAEIREDMPKSVDRLKLKTLLITHPDKDHMNRIHEIFSEDQSFEIDNVVLSGVMGDYLKKQDGRTLLGWLADAVGKKAINPKRIVFTGTNHTYEKLSGFYQNTNPARQDAEARARSTNYKKYCETLYGAEPHYSQVTEELTELETYYARPYYSDKRGEKTRTEEFVEKALQFSKTGTMRILCMNPTHAQMASGRIGRLNDDENTTSTVLRFEVGEKSLLLAADATGVTWRGIQDNYRDQPGVLSFTHTLMSHHGSLKDGCVSANLPKILPTKTLLISAGRQKGHGHQRKEAVDFFRASETLLYTQQHYLSTFEGDAKAHKMRRLERAIFSTGSSGTIHLRLHEREVIVYVSHNLSKAYRIDTRDRPAAEILPASVRHFVKQPCRNAVTGSLEDPENLPTVAAHIAELLTPETAAISPSVCLWIKTPDKRLRCACPPRSDEAEGDIHHVLWRPEDENTFSILLPLNSADG